MNVPKGDFCLDLENRGFYLIMEDISGKYQMHNKDFNGLSFAQINGILTKMAHFHALTFACNQKYPKWELNSLYEKFIIEDDIIEATERNIKILLTDLEQNPDLHQKVSNLKTNWIQAFKEFCCLKDERFVSHGDLWLNNVMFNSEDESLIFDWQMLVPDHPIIDLALMICTREHL